MFHRHKNVATGSRSTWNVRTTDIWRTPVPMASLPRGLREQHPARVNISSIACRQQRSQQINRKLGGMVMERQTTLKLTGWGGYVCFLGLDWAKDHHAVVTLAPDGGIVLDMQIAHDAEGWQSLRKRLMELAGADLSVVAATVETISGPWDFVIRFPSPAALAKAGKRAWEKFLHTHQLYRPSTYAKRLEIFARAQRFCGTEPVTKAKSLLGGVFGQTAPCAPAATERLSRTHRAAISGTPGPRSVRFVARRRGHAGSAAAERVRPGPPAI